MDFKDYYSTLGVAKTATEKEIKQAYRKLARKHHPDVNPGDKSAEARFKDITEAYEVLGDPAKRKKYDELGSNWRMYEQAGAGQPGSAGPGAGGWNVNFGGGAPGGGFRTMTEEEMREAFGDADPFSDFFHTFFGGGGPMGGEDAGRTRRGGRARAPRQGRDVEHELELGLEDAYHGAMRRLSMTHDGAGAHRRRPHSRGRRRGIARPRRRRRRAWRRRRSVGGSVSANQDLAAPAIRTKGPRPVHPRLRAADDRRARRRGGSQDAAGQAAASEDSPDDPDRPGIPAEGARDAGGRQA